MTSRLWKEIGGARPTRTGYNGMFGDSFFSDCWDVVDRPINKIIHEDVTSDVTEDKIKPIFRKSHLSRMSSDDIYQVMLEVSHFAPSDLTVKLVNDKTVIVEGKHPERKDPQGFVSREFTRKYNLPDSVNPSTVECYLSADGVLVIRGHAERPSSSASNGLHSGQIIPIYTHGYHTKSLNHETQHHVERIIPITREDRCEIDDGKHSGRNSRSSTVNMVHDQNKKSRMTPDLSEHTVHESERREKLFENGGRHQKERTVSFSDESREESLTSDRTIHHYQSSSREDHSQGPIPIITSPTTPRNQDSSMDRLSPFLMDFETSQKSSMSTDGWKANDDHSDKHTQHIPVVTTSSTSNEESRRSRSRNESMESQQSERIFSSRNSDFGKEIERLSPFGNRLRDRDIFADFDLRSQKLGLGNSKLWDDFDMRMDHLPVTSKEEQYEKRFEKGLKDGQWTESFEERFHSEQYSKSSSNKITDNGRGYIDNYRSLQQQLRDRPKEHRINISSPA